MYIHTAVRGVNIHAQVPLRSASSFGTVQVDSLLSEL